MTKITLELLSDINKHSMDVTDDYDSNETENAGVTARLPN
ncbi:hypothetical protein JMUB7504_27280 [Staphylococcus aureus]